MTNIQVVHISRVIFSCSFSGMLFAQWIESASGGKGEVTPHKVPLSPLSSRPQMAVSPPKLFNANGCSSDLWSSSTAAAPNWYPWKHYLKSNRKLHFRKILPTTFGQQQLMRNDNFWMKPWDVILMGKNNVY